MSQIIIGQVLFVLASLFNGMLLMAGYDVLRFIRWLIPHGKVWLWVEDTIYWCLAALPTFYLFFRYNEGVIRWYGLVGILLGAVLYEAGISLPLRRHLVKYGNWIRRKLLVPIEKIRRKKKERRQKKKAQRGRQKEIQRNRQEEKQKEKKAKKLEKEKKRTQKKNKNNEEKCE
ncbi:MAG: spore cortex biosynthesis protein YabQ [Lachnospiraceae bacterium]|nr:spore cortex biosynthesis protein YabQ [Lachnospiraceae bacterium]